MAVKTQANIGFEKQLWDAACVLWGHIPAAEYRKVIIIYQNLKRLKMEKVYFKDLFDVSSGLSKGAKELANGDNPFLTFKTIFNNTFLPDVITDTANTSEIEQKKYSVERGDVFLTRTSETTNELGMSSVALKDYPNAVFNGFSKRLRVKPEISTAIDLKYLGYFLRSRLFRDQVDAMSNTSTRASLNIEMINRLYLVLPDLSTQERIGNMLYLLDDKIKNNSAINQNLQAQAQAIYTDLFITNSDQSWPIGHLSDLITVKYGKDHKKLSDGTIPVYGSGGIIRYVEKPLYDKESVLIPRKGTLNNVMYANEPFWSVDTMFYTEMKQPDVAKFVYHFVKSKDLASLNAGSAVPSMTTDILNSMELRIPDRNALKRFEELVAPMYQEERHNAIESKRLSELRDGLLPKLMSGELDVSKLEV